jgi:hypothetical protein
MTQFLVGKDTPASQDVVNLWLEKSDCDGIVRLYGRNPAGAPQVLARISEAGLEMIMTYGVSGLKMDGGFLKVCKR